MNCENKDSADIDSFVFTLSYGEVKVEALSPSNANELNRFFLSIQQEQTVTKKHEDRLRRTVQIKKQTSEICLGASFRDEIIRSGGTPRLRSETVNHVTSKPPTKLSRTISSKSLKRTLSVGKFSRDKISKPPPEKVSNQKSSKSEFSFQSLTDKMKRRKTTSSAPIPRKSSKKKKGTL